jgi:hypothetical protein
MESKETQIAQATAADVTPTEKEPETAQPPAYTANGNSDQESLDQEAQAGVKGVQATAAVWTKSHMILAYVM